MAALNGPLAFLLVDPDASSLPGAASCAVAAARAEGCGGRCDGGNVGGMKRALRPVEGLGAVVRFDIVWMCIINRVSAVTTEPKASHCHLRLNASAVNFPFLRLAMKKKRASVCGLLCPQGARLCPRLVASPATACL